MTAIDDVEVKVGEVKKALSLQLERQLASMKFDNEPKSFEEKKAREILISGTMFAKDSLKLFVENFCLLLDTAAKQAIEEDQD